LHAIYGQYNNVDGDVENNNFEIVISLSTFYAMFYM